MKLRITGFHQGEENKEKSNRTVERRKKSWEEKQERENTLKIEWQVN